MEQGFIPRLGLLLFFALVGFAYEKYGTRQTALKRKPFGFTLTLAAIIFLIMAGIYGVQGKAFFLIPLAAAAAFLLPALLNQTWYAYNDIPEKQFPVWFSAPEEMMPAEIGTGPSVDLHFEVEVPGQVSKNNLMLFTKVLVNESLGQGFIGALIRHNEKFPGTAVDVTDAQGHPYGWQFYEVQLQGTRKTFLDPKILPGAETLKNRTQIAARRCHSQRPVIYRMKAR